jgi:ABC-2 type transport system permease protein
MSRLVTLTGREIRAVLLAPSSWVILALFLFLTAYFFRLVLRWVDGDVSLAYRTFASSVYFQILLGVLPPLLTMRSLSAERASGTLELLLTAPVTDVQVVVAKFFGGFFFYALLWLPTLLFPLALQWFGGLPDVGVVTAFTVGIFALGALLVSVGIFCSSLTANLLSAFFLAFALNVALLFGTSGLAWIVRTQGARDWIDAINISAHLDDFSRGILDVRYLVAYGTGTLLFLFLTVRSLEARQWR